MHVKFLLLAAAASGAIFYAVGRSDRDMPPVPAPQPFPSAVAQERAEGVPPPATSLAQSPATPARPSPTVDESALRYFASQGDKRRLDAEMARLRALYPEWKPPADLNAPGSAGDPGLERMWKLFADGKTSEVRAAIAERSAAEPNWRPPAELSEQLDRAEAAQRLVNASNAKQWAQVIRIGTETPALLTCANVDALWRVAEAFIRTERLDRARDAYGYVLTNCNNPGERLGTMQKVLASLPETMTTQLLAQERDGEFVTIRDEMARRRIGRAADDPTLTAAPEDLRRIEALASAGPASDDAILLGFYTFRHNDPAKALTWFQTALGRDGGAKAAEGAVLALGAVGKFQEAETLGSQWLEAGPANRKAYLDVATAVVSQEPPPRLDRPVIERIVKTVSTDRYAPGAAGLGWYAYNSGQVSAAGQWFDTALSWDGSYEPAAYGLALVRQRLRNQAGLRAIVAEWGGRSQRIAAILNPALRRNLPERETAAAPALPEPAVTAPPRTRDAAARQVETAYAEPRTPLRPARVRAAPALPAEEPVAALSRERPAARAPVSDASCGTGRSGSAALQRGWCLLGLKRPVAAAAAFDDALRTGTGQVAADAAAGKTYAKLQQGLTAEAGAAAASAPMPRQRRAELTTTLLAERFYALYDAKNFNAALVTLEERARYAPESTDLMMMRGWAYFNLARYDDARRVFKALQRAGYAQGLAGLTAIDDATRRNRY